MRVNAGQEPPLFAGAVSDAVPTGLVGTAARAHQAAAHETWFREQVQASIDDPRASVADEVAKEQFAAKRAALAKRAGVAKKKAARRTV